MRFSYEFFPPKGRKAYDALWADLPDLMACGPDFCTVTSGVDHSKRNGTVAALTRMMDERPVPVAAHVTFIDIQKPDFFAYIDALWTLGVRKLVVLRGDLPEGLSWPLDRDGEYFQYTNECVAAVKDRHDFDVSVGAYPEKHPDAVDLSSDIRALKLKCDAGADRAFTQFFFDNDVYFDFLDHCGAAGIDTPIYPGLVPVHDFAALTRFAARCGAVLPSWLNDVFEPVVDKPEEAKKRALDILQKQVQGLLDGGVEHVHFYTLNKAAITTDVCRALKG